MENNQDNRTRLLIKANVIWCAETQEPLTKLMKQAFIFNEYIRIPTSFCLTNIFDKGLSPFFYVTYIYIAARICLANRVTFTVKQIVSECRQHVTNRNKYCSDVAKAVEYLADNGYISIDTGDVGNTDEIHIEKYDEPIDAYIIQSAFDIRRNYFKIKYGDYKKLMGLDNSEYSRPEYALLLYLYIAPQIFERSDKKPRAFFEKRENTCKNLGISGYYYDMYTDAIDDLKLLIKWRPNIKYYNSGEIRSLPNIYTKHTTRASSAYWDALSKLTGITDIDILMAMTKPDEKRIPDNINRN